MWKTLCIFGDSITQGFSDEESGGWVSRLFAHTISKDSNLNIFNLGIGGDTTAGIIARFEREIATRNPDFLVFAIGINDAVTYQDKGVSVSEESFSENIRTIIDRAELLVEKTVFIGLTYVDESKTNPVLGSTTGKCYANIRIERFDAIMKDICRERGAPYLPVADCVTTNDLPDGLHPNAHGHEMMFKKIKEFLCDQGML